jgi:hypothetical protein
MAYSPCLKGPLEGPLSTAALKEVFADINDTQNITLRWLPVESQSVNTGHKTQEPFEKDAVKD